MKLLFVLYLLVLLKVIVFKYPLGILREIAGTWSKEVLWEGLSGANFVLFRTIKMYIRHWNNRGLNSFGNLVGNVVTFIPLSSNLLNQPPGLDKFARASGEPIAFISNGDPIFSPFIFMMFPPHIIGVVNIIL